VNIFFKATGVNLTFEGHIFEHPRVGYTSFEVLNFSLETFFYLTGVGVLGQIIFGALEYSAPDYL